MHATDPCRRSLMVVAEERKKGAHGHGIARVDISKEGSCRSVPPSYCVMWWHLNSVLTTSTSTPTTCSYQYSTDIIARSDPILLRFFEYFERFVKFPENLCFFELCSRFKTTGNLSNPEFHDSS